ncbi:sialate O-acetylesterase [Rubritalea tangerina]|uniref:Sialate O-acetylesterase n=1 Tax=Rubritalea tangerina TaxID=430798 RepID=A0ABW4ZDU2_9BACT
MKKTIITLILPIFIGTIRAEDIVDVYLLIGQSNMEGVGRRSKLEKEYKEIDKVQIFHSKSIGDGDSANKWVPLKPAGWKGTSTGGFGLEISFGKSLHQNAPNRNFGLIKHAVGGTSLFADWVPGSSPHDTSSWGPQYATFQNTTTKALEALKRKGKTPIIRGILWQQGEADSKKQENAEAYEQRLTQFIDITRETFAEYSSNKQADSIRFILGQVIPDYTRGSAAHKAYPFRNDVRNAQLTVSQKLKNVRTIKTNKSFETHADEKDGYRDGDNIHFNADGLLKLGEEMAKAALNQ